MTVDDLEFREFYAAQYTRLCWLGLLLTGDQAEAEELAQEALVRTWWRWALHRPDDPAAYARKVLVNRHRSLLRRGRGGVAVPGQDQDRAGPAPGDEQAMVLWQAGQGLPPRQRAVPPSAVPTGSPGPQSTAPSTSSSTDGPAAAGPWPPGARWPWSSPWPWSWASPACSPAARSCRRPRRLRAGCCRCPPAVSRSPYRPAGPT